MQKKQKKDLESRINDIEDKLEEEKNNRSAADKKVKSLLDELEEIKRTS